jgi:hypothetical protein
MRCQTADLDRAIAPHANDILVRQSDDPEPPYGSRTGNGTVRFAAPMVAGSDRIWLRGLPSSVPSPAQ